MKLGLLVTASPFDCQSSDSALRFARAAIQQGHSIVRVFFFMAGVHNANKQRAVPPGARDVSALWHELAASSDIELVACITAANKRGITEATLAPGFTLGGLGQLAELVVEADRLVVFGG